MVNSPQVHAVQPMHQPFSGRSVRLSRLNIILVPGIRVRSLPLAQLLRRRKHCASSCFQWISGTWERVYTMHYGAAWTWTQETSADHWGGWFWSRQKNIQNCLTIRKTIIMSESLIGVALLVLRHLHVVIHQHPRMADSQFGSPRSKWRQNTSGELFTVPYIRRMWRRPYHDRVR